MSRSELDALIDAYWGEGVPTAEKLAIFDKFWSYADAHYAAFQGIRVDWRAERRRYRDEVAAGVSRGRFAAIMNQLSLALRDSHSLALDTPVNIDTVPDRGVPLFGTSAWIVDPSGACMTAQADGSSLVYSAMPDHPLGLEPGDRILGYDGVPWRVLYQRLLRCGAAVVADHVGILEERLQAHVRHVRRPELAPLRHDGHREARPRRRSFTMPTSLMPGPLFYGLLRRAARHSRSAASPRSSRGTSPPGGSSRALTSGTSTTGASMVTPARTSPPSSTSSPRSTTWTA